MAVVIQTPGGKLMPRVDIEIARKIIRLSNEGLSYTAIGKRLGYNNKTVSLWVKKAKESERTRTKVAWRPIPRPGCTAATPSVYAARSPGTSWSGSQDCTGLP